MQSKSAFLEGTEVQLELWAEHLSILRDQVARCGRSERRELGQRLAALDRRRRQLKLRLRASDLGSNAARDLRRAVREFRDRAREAYYDVQEVGA
jgi:hypothetical protein